MSASEVSDQAEAAICHAQAAQGEADEEAEQSAGGNGH